MQHIVPIRRDITSFSEGEKQNLLNALYKMKASPSPYNASYSSYDYFTYIHKTQPISVRSSWRFLPWHREFLFHFERELSYFIDDSNSTTFRLPYWDMTDEVSTFHTLFDESFIGGNGEETLCDSKPCWILPDSCQLSCDKWSIPLKLTKDTPFVNVSCLSRQIGANPMFPSLPEQSLWDTLKSCEYDIGFGDNAFDFENLDVMIHGYIGGHDSSTASTVDPLFFLLYSWIDAMWALYQDHHGTLHGFDSFDAFDENESIWSESLFEGYFDVDTTKTIGEIMDIRNQLDYAYDLQDSLLLLPVDIWWKSNVMMAFMMSIALCAFSAICCWGFKKVHCQRPAKVHGLHMHTPTALSTPSRGRIEATSMRMGNWSLSSPASSLTSLL